MTTKTKTIHYITLPSGLVFTSKRDFTETLFHPINGKTADGYFTAHKSAKHGTRSLRFHHGNGELFALIVSNGRDASARTAWKQDGKVWNLYGLTDEGKRLLGFHGKSYTGEIDACIELVNKAMERGAA